MITILLAVSVAANAVLAWKLARAPRGALPTEIRAAITFALNKVGYVHGRTFLRLYLNGDREGLAVTFPEWDAFRNRFTAIDADTEA